MLENSLLSNAGLKPGLYKIYGTGLQLPGLAELSYGEKNEQNSHGDSNHDEPARGVAGPSSQSCVEPCQREDRKDRSGNFVENLTESSPETLKTALLLGRASYVCGRGHRSILTQNT